ncbi:MAG TPA: type II secretion system protein [Thermoanaerobaculia bacterium]|nr:type II secretion system protein [Thermoanaerobaculia bacterium]
MAAPPCPRSSTRGYTLVFLLVGMTVMAVLIAAVLPLASAEAQRDKEQELIFRGLQYAEGIRNFKRRYARYPNSLKEMFEIRPRTLRKLWKDPITNSNDWGLITSTAGAPALGPPVSGPGAVPPGGTGLTPPPTPTPAPTPVFGGSSFMSGGAPMGPITGVYSKSKKKSFQIYQDHDVYADWHFTEASLIGPGLPAGVAPGPGVPPAPAPAPVPSTQ